MATVRTCWTCKDRIYRMKILRKSVDTWYVVGKRLQQAGLVLPVRTLSLTCAFEAANGREPCRCFRRSVLSVIWSQAFCRAQQQWMLVRRRIPVTVFSAFLASCLWLAKGICTDLDPAMVTKCKAHCSDTDKTSSESNILYCCKCLPYGGTCGFPKMVVTQHGLFQGKSHLELDEN